MLKLEDIYRLYISFLPMSVSTTLLQFLFGDYFTQLSEFHQYNTRSASRGDLFLVRKNTMQYGLRSICFNGAKLWNTIPSDI